MKLNVIGGIALGLIFTAVGFSCSKSSSDGSTTVSRKLYIASGLCYSGAGFAAPTINDVGQLLSRLDLDSRQYEVIHDYADLASEVSGTYAAGITTSSDGYTYVAVENSINKGNRRVDKIVSALFGDKLVWIKNTTRLINGGAIVGIGAASDHGVLFGTTTAVERYDASPTRISTGGGATNPWGNAFAGNCASNNTHITSLVVLPSAVSGDTIGKFIYAHAAAGHNDIGIISKDGMDSTTPCLFNTTGGAAGALINAATANNSYGVTVSGTPTAVSYVPSTTPGTGKLLVAYSSSSINDATNLNNGLVMYDFTENTTAGETATLSNGQVLYNDTTYFFGVSAMAFDAADNSLYVSRVDTNAINSGVPHGYIVEKFTIDLTTPGATRVPNSDSSSFEVANSFNKCVTSMYVGE